MLTLNIIEQTLKCQKISQKTLCEHLGIGKQAFSDWKCGKSESYKKYLPQIADYLNVSIDYLLGKTDQKEKPSDNGELPEGHVKFLGRDGKTKIIKATPELIALLETMPSSDANI